MGEGILKLKERLEKARQLYSKINSTEYYKRKKFNNFQTSITDIKTKYDNFLSSWARSIKQNYPHLDTDYNLTKIQRDLALNSEINNKEEFDKINELVKNKKPHFNWQNIIIPDISKLTEDTKKLLKEIPPKSENIIIEKEDFDWIKTSFQRHRNGDYNIEKCKFCNNKLTLERFKILENKLKDRESKMKDEINKLKSEWKNINIEYANGLAIINNELSIDNSIQVLYGETTIDRYNQKLNNIIEQNKLFLKSKKEIEQILHDKNNNIFSDSFEMPNFEGLKVINTEFTKLKNIYDKSLEEYNKIYKEKENYKKQLLIFLAKNGEKYQEYTEEKNSAIENIKTIAKKYNKDIQVEFDNQKLHNINFNTIAGLLKNKQNCILGKIKQYGDKINKLISQNIPDENEINNNIISVLGHDRFTVKKKENANKDEIKNEHEYIIIRNNGEEIKSADELNKFLSEGEKTAIAFAYFMTRKAAIFKTENPKDNSILVIDDPICSLDETILYRVFDQIHKMTKYFQSSIILTHNYYFAYCFRRIEYNSFFMIKTNNKTSSVSENNNNILRDEYRYLFKKVHEFSIQNQNTHPDLFGIENIMRRLWEAFFRFKFGYTPDENNKIKQLKNNESLTDIINALKICDDAKQIFNRVINDGSHFMIKTTQRPNFVVLQDCAKVIMKTIQGIDNEHYTSHLEIIK